MKAPVIIHCGLDHSPADPLDALEKLYRAETEGNADEAAQAWAEAMITADATLQAAGRDVRPFADCFEDVPTPTEGGPTR